MYEDYGGLIVLFVRCLALACLGKVPFLCCGRLVGDSPRLLLESKHVGTRQFILALQKAPPHCPQPRLMGVASCSEPPLQSPIPACAVKLLLLRTDHCSLVSVRGRRGHVLACVPSAKPGLAGESKCLRERERGWICQL